MRRVAGIVLGVAAHLALIVTICFLFSFLMGSRPPSQEAGLSAWWLLDVVLATQFGVLHSVLLLPAVRRRLPALLPAPALSGCFFTLMTSLSLLLLINAWQTSPVVIWQVKGFSATVIHGAYVLSWVGLIYSLNLTGIGFQTGWTPFWAWVRGKEVPREGFQVRGAYHLLRHPAYLSFLGQLWFTPLMTLDRALLTGLLTAYIFIGSFLKDRRLVFYLGDVYRQYQSRVPGYPFIRFGPLSRVPLAREASEPASVGR